MQADFVHLTPSLWRRDGEEEDAEEAENEPNVPVPSDTTSSPDSPRFSFLSRLELRPRAA